ncbi:serine hydrolase [Robertkochia aurantiaca]|uniref:serine hydrolase n=1 Tax=Robertkochia aurantiaca TaxID=2873700 RepID=UPI001CCFD635|nr:serine hydrolase [Robertkochia sp. 3YJGBD-33]
MSNQTIGKNLLYQRQLKGLTQEELAERTQVTVRTIQRIEKGSVNPHLQTIKLLAAALEIEPGDLLPLDDPKKEDIQKKWLIFMHGTPLFGLFLPLFNILIPLFLWIHKRDDNDLYDQHGRKILNFQITATLLYMLSFVALLTIEKWGFIIFISFIPLYLGIILINVITVVKKTRCFYPPSIPFFRTASSKTKRHSSLVLIVLLLMCTAPSAHSQTIERLDGSEIQVKDLNREIEILMGKANVTGMAISVFNNSEVVHTQTYGFKNADLQQALSPSTNIYGASFSKAVFSVLVMKLVEEGFIDLDTPLQSYLPKKIYQYEPETRWHDDYSDLKNDSLYSKITARMCLSHTAGFPNYRWFEPDQKLRVVNQPGERYQYSGEGLIYLQVVLEKITGKGLQELAEDRIFKPLKMTNSSYQWEKRFEKDFAFGHNREERRYKKDKDNEPRGAGTLETTAQDYTLFLQAVLNRKLLSESSYNELFSPQIRIRTKNQFGPGANKMTDANNDINLSYALGWGYLETPFGKGVFKEGHGNGFQHYSILFPETGKGIMIMSNSDNAESIFKYVLQVALKDTYTPWKWENYIPYDHEPNTGS